MRARLLTPASLEDAIGVFVQQAGGVGTGNLMYLNAVQTGHKAEDIVAENGLATLRELVVQLFHIGGIHDEHVGLPGVALLRAALVLNIQAALYINVVDLTAQLDELLHLQRVKGKVTYGLIQGIESL